MFVFFLYFYLYCLCFIFFRRCDLEAISVLSQLPANQNQPKPIEAITILLSHLITGTESNLTVM